jgi:hypothetical protein
MNDVTRTGEPLARRLRESPLFAVAEGLAREEFPGYSRKVFPDKTRLEMVEAVDGIGELADQVDRPPLRAA